MKRFLRVKPFWLLLIVPFLLPLVVYLKSIYDASFPKILEIGDFAPRCATFSPNGRWLATVGDKNGDGLIRVLETKNFESVKRFAITGLESTESLFFSPDSSRLVLSNVGKVAVWNISTSKSPIVATKVNDYWVDNAGNAESGEASPDGSII